MEIILVIGLLVLAVVLFATERFSVDVVTLFMLVVLTIAGILSPGEAFEAFSSDFIIMLAAIFVITAAIETSGVMDVLSEKFGKLKASEATGVLLWMMPFAAFLSGFVNNTTLTALLIPPLLGISKKGRISPSKLLMPMAFANIVGGNWTLIGTSANIAMSGYLAKEGFGQLSLFSIAPIGFVAFVVFMIYMLVIGRFLLPDRTAGSLDEDYKLRDYMSEVKILQGSHLIGQQVYESDLVHSGFRILGIFRQGRKFYPESDSVFEEEDMVLVNGNVRDLLAIKDTSGIDIVADTLDVFYFTGKKDHMQLTELLIPGDSGLAGKTIKETDFRRRYGLVVVAVHRAGTNLMQKIGSIPLQVGDMLLVQGTTERLAEFNDQHNLVLLDEHVVNPKRVRRGFAVIGLFLVAVVLTSLKIIPPEIAFLSAALGAIMLGIIKSEEAYRHIDWRMLVLIAGMTAFGTAMKNSGADVFISNHMITLFDQFGARGILLGFMIITVLLTQPLSNAAAGLVVLPVALQSAQSLGANPLTFGVAIMLTASVSVMTPFEPSCILIYGPGKYKFTDFLKLGGLLTVLMMAVIYFLVPVFWPMFGEKIH